jgi:hypothetical protein
VARFCKLKKLECKERERRERKKQLSGSGLALIWGPDQYAFGSRSNEIGRIGLLFTLVQI